MPALWRIKRDGDGFEAVVFVDETRRDWSGAWKPTHAEAVAWVDSTVRSLALLAGAVARSVALVEPEALEAADLDALPELEAEPLVAEVWHGPLEQQRRTEAAHARANARASGLDVPAELADGLAPEAWGG